MNFKLALQGFATLCIVVLSLSAEGDYPTLAAIRLPIVWADEALSIEQSQRLGQEVGNQFLGAQASYQPIRQLIPMLAGQIEVQVLEPADVKLKPVPPFLIQGSHRGDPALVCSLIQQSFLAVIESATGQSMSWLKFNPEKTEEGLYVVKTYFAFFHVRVQVDARRYQIAFSTDPTYAWLKQIVADKTNSEISLKPSRIWQIYESFIRQFLPSHVPLMHLLGCESIRELRFENTSGGINYEWKGSIQFEKQKTGLWAKMVSNSQPAQVVAELPDQVALLHLPIPRLNRSDLEPWVGPAWAILWERMLLNCGATLSIYWPQKLPAPVFVLPVSSTEEFHKNVQALLGVGIKTANEKEGELSEIKHIFWRGGTLSYRLRAKQVEFSPLLHTLLDAPTPPAMKKSEERLLFTSASEGDASSAYYTMALTLIQLAVATGREIDPMIFPPWKRLRTEDQHWKSQSVLRIVEKSPVVWSVQWRQPYGVWGMMAGIRQDSAFWLKFSSLLSMTVHSL